MFSLKTINNTDPGSYKFTIRTKGQTNEKRKQNERKTIERFTRTIRNERYTKRTNQLHERTIHANETNEKRKRYEISVNLNNPGSVIEVTTWAGLTVL
jgi:hypothetical protein